MRSWTNRRNELLAKKMDAPEPLYEDKFQESEMLFLKAAVLEKTERLTSASNYWKTKKEYRGRRGETVAVVSFEDCERLMDGWGHAGRV